MHIGPCYGRGMVPPGLGAWSLPRNVLLNQMERVPILPREYYSGLAVDLMMRDLFIGADGSAFAMPFRGPLPIVFHVREKRLGTVYSVHCVYRIVFDSGYRSTSFVLDIERDGWTVWLVHDVVSAKPCARCSRSVARLQSRFRRRRAARKRWRMVRLIHKVAYELFLRDNMKERRSTSVENLGVEMRASIVKRRHAR